MENQNVRLAVAFIIGLVVGLGVYWLFDQDAAMNNGNNPLGEEELATTTVSAIEGDNGLIVEDQGAGRMVNVSELRLKQPGWVAIHDDVNGTPGRILGARVFDTGTSAGAVELLRATETGKSYFAVIHDDDGAFKTFNPATDKPLLDDEGKMILVRFQISGSTSPTPSPVTTLNGGDKD
ncbi:hypothetical protein KW782_02715 [Candidatus Parcubacteria bacterium]|nr:hypothetical protein [Candidatus Parcubacteria bacterium]